MHRLMTTRNANVMLAKCVTISTSTTVSYLCKCSTALQTTQRPRIKYNLQNGRNDKDSVISVKWGSENMNDNTRIARFIT